MIITRYLQINGEIPDNLQVLNVTSLSNEECKKLATVHDSHLCTISPRGQGICGVSLYNIMRKKKIISDLTIKNNSSS